MKKDQKEKLNQLSLSELEKELVSENRNLAKLVIDRSLAKLKNFHQVGETKRKIAVIRTKIVEKRLAKSLLKK
jgi:ribosomal protein L29